MEKKQLIEDEFGVLYLYQQKLIIKNLNAGKRVGIKTLKKHKLEHLLQIKGVKEQVIFPKDYQEEITNLPSPTFTKQDIVEWIGTNYSNQGTKTTYLNRYKSCPDFTSDDLLVETVDFEAFIPANSIKQVLSPLSQYLKEKYPTQFNDLKTKITAQINLELNREKVKASRKQEEPLVVTAQELKNNYEHILCEDDNYSTDRMKLLLGLYTELPLRDDFGNVSFTDKLNDGFNFINLETGTFTVLPKKGAREQKTYELSPRLITLVKRSIELFPRDYLFTSSTVGQPKGKCDKMLTQLYRKYFKKKLTINDIRKSFTSDARHNGTIADEIEMAETQQHSINTANTFYQRSV